MSLMANAIAESGQHCMNYARQLLQDIPASQFARFARLGDTVVASNHPAFIFGHLSLYGSRVVNELGGDASAVMPTDRYNELFSPVAECVDDPDGTIYPPMDEITERFFASYTSAVDALRQADDATLSAVNPNERGRAKFATMGSMHAFYLGGHLMIHLGQLSAWRRMQGLGQASKPAFASGSPKS
ncbi:DinB family protein [Crateriforma conspicua]|uniref:DinB family protein n=1 Tax=Crateriforma conspicua TaxID=2527996 RepID=UPI001188658D|nr:DinB family protein [Crateriforma conspicua]QDV60975.1 DinB superfamily protein [Crateriforma conspicua]